MKHLTFIFCLISTCLCFAQRIEFADAGTGIAIKDVTIILPSNKTVISTTKGIIFLTPYKKQKNFIARAEGYQEVVFSRKTLLANTLFLQPITNDLDEVIVSHSKWKEKRINIPKKTSLQNRVSLLSNQPQTAADAIGIGNTIFIQKSQLGGGSPIIRGFATNRILLTVDGVRMNNAIFRSGNVQNIISIDPYIINQSEIIHGPGSVVYGSDAIGGVINFNTLDTKGNSPNKKGMFSQRFSSANTESTSHLEYRIGKNKWNSVTSLSYSKFGDLTQGKYGPSNYIQQKYIERVNGVDQVLINENNRRQLKTGYQQYNFFNKISYKANHNHNINLTSIFSRTSDYNRYDKLQEKNEDGNLNFSEWFYGPQQWLFLNLTSNYKTEHLLFDELKTSLAFQSFKESRNQRNFNNDFRINNSEKVNAYSLNFDAIKKLKESILSYGVELIHNKVNSNAYSEEISNNNRLNNISLRYPDGASWNSFSIYSSLNHALDDKNKLSAGLRYNFVNIKANFDDPVLEFPFDNINLNNDAINGNLGWIHKVSKKWNSSLFLSTAFRAPNIDDIGKIFQSSEPGTLIVPNPDLKPETAYNIESNIVFHTKRTNITLSPYFTFLNNALSRNSFSFNNLEMLEFQGVKSQITAIQNSNSQKIYGIDFNGHFQLSKSITADFSYHFIKGKEKLPNNEEVAVRHVTPNFGKLGLTYKKNRLEITPFLQFSESLSNKELNPRERTKTNIYAINAQGLTYAPSWHTLNLNSQLILTKDLKVSLNLENITNQRYRTYSSGLSAPGFNIIGALQLRF